MTGELRGKHEECGVLSQDSRKVHGVGLRTGDYQASSTNNSGDFNAPSHNVLESNSSRFGIAIFVSC